jgi:hypothetical protein
MSRKHYKAIAEILKAYRASIRQGHTWPEEQQFDLMVNELMSLMKTDNPNFDKARFTQATH